MKMYTRAMLAITLWVLGTSGVVARQSIGGPPVATGIRSKIACAEMAGQMVPASAIALPTNGALVSVAGLEPGSGPVAIKANFIPEHCFIQGAIKPLDPKAPNILFGIAIPTVWNQQSFTCAMPQLSPWSSSSRF